MCVAIVDDRESLQLRLTTLESPSIIDTAAALTRGSPFCPSLRVASSGLITRDLQQCSAQVKPPSGEHLNPK